MNDVERWLDAIGYIQFLERDTAKYIPVGDRALNAYVYPQHLQTLLHVLRHDKRFYEGPFHWLHRNVGTHLTEFRSYAEAIIPGDPRSLQIVVDSLTGKLYADLDRFNYQDVANMLGHLVLEVMPNPFQRWWRTDGLARG